MASEKGKKKHLGQSWFYCVFFRASNVFEIFRIFFVHPKMFQSSQVRKRALTPTLRDYQWQEKLKYICFNSALYTFSISHCTSANYLPSNIWAQIFEYVLNICLINARLDGVNPLVQTLHQWNSNNLQNQPVKKICCKCLPNNAI